MTISFDGPTKLMTLASQAALDVVDLYSRWKDWVLTADNSKYQPAFVAVGGESISAISGTAIPLYAFLVNGWRIRPQETNHTLDVTGGILLVDGGGDPFVNTLGSFAVRINYQQPVQAITVSTGGGGLTTAQDQRLERIEKLLRNKQITDPVAGEMRVYDDDGVTVLMHGDVFEDAGGGQRYRGNGAERRERLT
jgi:hypothetical protein